MFITLVILTPLYLVTLGALELSSPPPRERLERGVILFGQLTVTALYALAVYYSISTDRLLSTLAP